MANLIVTDMNKEEPGLAGELAALAGNLEALKGRHYSQTVISMFSILNFVEDLITDNNGTETKKDRLAEEFSIIIGQLGAAQILMIAVMRYKDWQDQSETEQQKISKQLSDELSADLRMFNKKMEEYQQ